MPRLARILIYPVKSLPGVRVEQATLTACGALVHDREYRLRGANGIVNGKRNARIHQLPAACAIDDGKVRVTLGSGGAAQSFVLGEAGDAQHSQLEARLTAFFGEAVHIDRDTQGGFPDDPDAPGPTVVADASLAAAASWYPGQTADDMRRRFRANLEFADCPAFWEDRLFGSPGKTVAFRIGDAQLIGTNPCQRCVVPTRDPSSGSELTAFQRTFVQQRRASLPPWANRERFDFCYRFATNTRGGGDTAGKIIRVGDPVDLL